LRFKIPRPTDKDLCFKVEVRPLDLEITPFENTAMITLILLIYGMIMRTECDFIIPISLVDENFERAYQNDAINKKKFWWRINAFKSNEVSPYICERKCKEKDKINYEEDMKNNIKELTINEIFNGSKEYNYPGIIHYLKLISSKIFNAEKYCEKYLNFISKRASGELWTDAKYIRNFVLNHPKYNKDSIINEEINYDLIKHILKIQNKEIKPKELFGDIDY
jgi:glutamate--cysteine ligase catalytic subunit